MEALGGQYHTRVAGIRFLEASWGRLGAPGGPSWGLLGPSWPSWRPLDPVLGPSWRPKSDLKSLPKSIILWITFLINFSIDFGSIFDRFSTPKSIKNRSKNHLKSEQAQTRKILKIIGRGCVFEDLANRKAINNRQKIGLQVDEDKDPPNDRF